MLILGSTFSGTWSFGIPMASYLPCVPPSPTSSIPSLHSRAFLACPQRSFRLMRRTVPRSCHAQRSAASLLHNHPSPDLRYTREKVST